MDFDVTLVYPRLASPEEPILLKSDMGFVDYDPLAVVPYLIHSFPADFATIQMI
jgi:hypothetical protein